MDQYEKLSVVGRGAFGTVHLSRRIKDKKDVVIKQIPVEQLSKLDRKATLNEVRVLAMLQHPNIIEYYESFVQDRAMMIVMEYAAGGTLFDYVEERAAKSSPFGSRRWRELASRRLQRERFDSLRLDVASHGKKRRDHSHCFRRCCAFPIALLVAY